MAKAKKLTNRALADLCRQLAMILEAGISLQEGLAMLREDSASQEEEQLYSSLCESIDSGDSFFEALSAAGRFPDYMVQMARIGEQTGHLDDVMLSLSEYYEREESLKESLKGAVTYPLMLLGMMLLIIILLLTKVLPIFNQVFLQLGTELSGLPRALMELGGGIRRYAVLLVLLVLLIAGVCLYFAYSSRGRRGFALLCLRTGFLRKLYDRLFICRFAGAMALALSSGLTPESSLELVAGLSQDPRFTGRLEGCRQQVEQGEDLCAALQSSGILSGLYARMAAIGQRTGSMDSVMAHISGECQDELDRKIGSGLALIEPVLVVILSVTVGIILLSVMFPLLGIMSGI